METERKRQIYTVGQVNYYIKQIFDGDFLLKTISVKGEISNCKYHSSGHIYFSLKDGSGVLSCVMFASSAAGLKFRLEDGKKVVVTGSISVYEAAGRYQLYAKKVEEEGKGDLFLKYEELKKRLEEAGFFAEEYKQAIPRFAYRIGVVTAETGAVIRDIYNVSSRRNPYTQIYLYPAAVQGEGAAHTIAAGIQKLDTMGLDVIIIGRGGGSIEDLWAFNEEEVARAIFDCRTPLISAVGHETDFTIADFVADLRAPTPSAAAELAVFDYDRFEKDLTDYRFTLKRDLLAKLNLKAAKSREYRLALENLSPKNQLLSKKQRAGDCRSQLDETMLSCLDAAKEELKERGSRMYDLTYEKYRRKKETLALLAERLSGLSPLKRLSEGYAYASVQGRTLKSVAQVKSGDEISVALRDGTVEAEIVKVIEVDHE